MLTDSRSVLQVGGGWGLHFYIWHTASNPSTLPCKEPYLSNLRPAALVAMFPPIWQLHNMYYKNNIVNHQNILPVELCTYLSWVIFKLVIFTLKKIGGCKPQWCNYNNSIYLNTIKNSPKLMWSYKKNKIHFSDFFKVSMSWIDLIRFSRAFHWILNWLVWAWFLYHLIHF